MKNTNNVSECEIDIYSENEPPDTELELNLLGAVKNNDSDQVKFYLEAGTNVDYGDSRPLHLAANLGHISIIQILLSYQAEINHSVLLTAIYHGQIKTTKFLIQNGFNIKKIHSTFGFISKLPTGFIQYLINSGLELNSHMLENAAVHDHLDSFKYIYHKLDNVDIPKIWRMVYLNESFQVVDYLLDLETELDLTDARLVLAILRNAQIGLLKKILNRIPEPKDFLITGSVQLACQSDNYEIVKLLLELGLNPNEKADWTSRYTPLEFAVSRGNSELIKLLLSYGATTTWRCLRIASKINHFQIYKLIDQSKDWSKTELSESLVKAIKYNTNKDLWLYIYHQIDSLDLIYLEKIIYYCIWFDRLELLDFFIMEYGIDVVSSLINSVDCSENALQYLDKVYDIQF